MSKKKELRDKAQSTIKKSAKVATENWQPILVIAGIAFVLYVGKQFADKITGNSGPKETPPADISPEPGYAPSNVNTSQAANIATQLFLKMKDVFPKDQQVLDILENANLNHNGFYMVSEAFGIKKYDSFHGAYAANIGTPKNLIGWLNEELDSPEQRLELKRILPTVF